MTLYAEKLLPHNIEAEEALIGSLILDGECIARIAPLLHPLATGAGAEGAGRLPRGELLKEEELRFHALLQELSSSHRTVETLSKALPAGPHAEPARLRWWPFRRPR